VAGGPVAALRAAAAASPVPVTVSAEHEWRWTPDLERAVYFSCIEALQNAVKHADAAAIQVRVQPEVDAVTFEVRDDGHGFDPVQHPAGSGTVNMRDRVESIGGSLWVESTDQGTTVTGRIPFLNGEPSSAVAEI
jgi:signal transduction histidine kinase